MHQWSKRHFILLLSYSAQPKMTVHCSEGGKKKKNTILLKDKLFYCVGVGGCYLL